MPRPIWSGSVSFGLVNVPVKLVTATSSKDVRFHQLHDVDGGRIQQKRVCSVDGEEVAYDHIVKGYDLGGGRYVVIEPEELAALDVAATRTIDIEEFVDLADIDPVYFERSYYLVPDGRAEKPYALLVETMARTAKVAVGRFVLRTKQYLATLRAHDGVLVLATMLYDDEVVAPEDLEIPTTAATAPSEREVTMATQLVESLSAAFDPSKYTDDYRDKVLSLIEAKADGEVVAQPEAPAATAPVVDLMAALEASLAAARQEAGVSPADGTDVTVGSRTLRLSNLDKVLWPETGFTKGQLIDYYARVADIMVPHLQGRPITLRRWPNGVDAGSFYEKNCPSHRPPWVDAVRMGDVNYCLLNEAATLVWVANLAAIELHPSLATDADLDSPTSVVFDLDPGPPADVLDCARVALLVREVLGQLGLQLWPKTSGSKGLQLYLPLNGAATYAQTKPFAHAVARLLERDHPKTVVSVMERSRRKGKVFIDWSQNTASKTTVSVYSVRALPQPSVSTPVTWDELDDALTAGDAAALRFDPGQVLDRVGRWGDLHRSVLETAQELPGELRS